MDKKKSNAKTVKAQERFVATGNGLKIIMPKKNKQEKK